MNLQGKISNVARDFDNVSNAIVDEMVSLLPDDGNYSLDIMGNRDIYILTIMQIFPEDLRLSL
jgi:hypothetical protein